MMDRLVDVFIEFVRFFKFVMVLECYQAGVHLRKGMFKRVIGPGLVFYLPFGIDKLLWENVTLETLKTEPQALTTKDGVDVVVSWVITFSIEDIRTFILDVEGRNTVVGDTTYGTGAEFIRGSKWEELMTMDVGNEVAKKIRAAAKKYGVKIDKVQPVNFQRCRTLQLLGKPVWVEVTTK